jgi:dimethylglycine dehydrogenase
VATHTKVAVIGGGIGGCSLLWNLVQRGWNDVTLIEQNELTSGSTWHAAGLCTQFIGSPYLMKLLRHSLETYADLEKQKGHSLGLHQCGSLRIGTTEDRIKQFHVVKGIADQVGVPMEVVDRDRAAELFPLLDPEGIIGAAHLPTDGHVDPSGITTAFADFALAGGAKIIRHAPVLATRFEQGKWILETPKGEIHADIVVNAAGQWARQVGRQAGLELPVVPLQHHYVVTEPVAEVKALSTELPVLRDPDGSYYVRQEGEALIVGPFEQNALTWALDGIPDGFNSRLLPGNWDQIEPSMIEAAKRVPLLDGVGLKTILNGPDGYTPDGRCLMGPVPGVRNYHVLAGFSIFGIVFGGGAGRFAAEWIVDGQPSEDMWELDIRRFGPYSSSTTYTAERACDVYEREYAIHYPEEERPPGRPLKTGPLYDRLLARGAVYGARFGWERPLWYANDGQPAEDRYTWGRGNWHEAVGEECRTVRSAVGVLDQSSFAKFEISGTGAEAFLDRLCANVLPSAVGRIVLTQMCTPLGGIECDVTVTRLTEDRFYVVSAAATEHHDLAWIAAHLPDDGSVRLDNLSSSWGVLTLAGPNSRELLQAVTDADVSREAFPFFRAHHLHVGMAPAMALRVSYVGELGFELHHPVEYTRHIYDQLQGAGADLGLIDFGYRALDSMRLEKAYRLWGPDMSIDFNPLECGMERFVRFDKGDFIGRDALLRQREAGLTRELVCLALEEGDTDAHGFEPVRAGDDVVGTIASGGYGHVVETSIALGFLNAGYTDIGTEVSVNIQGHERQATVVEQPLYDPEHLKLRS